MKCDVCNNKIEETFLEKIKGIHLKINGKLKHVCNNCQKKFSKNKIKEKLK